VKKSVLPQKMTERERLLYAAFTENVNPMELKESNFDAGMQKVVEKLEKDCILEIRNYIPCTDGIKTVVELHDGPEENFFNCEDVLSAVSQRIQKWEENREIAKKAEIKRIKALLFNKIE
jgi:hypothetical protein